MLENILGCHVPLHPFLKDFQNLLTRDGGLQPGAFEFVHVFSVANE
jgi:hypothetical protein